MCSAMRSLPRHFYVIPVIHCGNRASKEVPAWLCKRRFKFVLAITEITAGPTYKPLAVVV